MMHGSENYDAIIRLNLNHEISCSFCYIVMNNNFKNLISLEIISIIPFIIIQIKNVRDDKHEIY